MHVIRSGIFLFYLLSSSTAVYGEQVNISTVSATAPSGIKHEKELLKGTVLRAPAYHVIKI